MNIVKRMAYKFLRVVLCEGDKADMGIVTGKHKNVHILDIVSLKKPMKRGEKDLELSNVESRLFRLAYVGEDGKKALKNLIDAATHLLETWEEDTAIKPCCRTCDFYHLKSEKCMCVDSVFFNHTIKPEHTKYKYCSNWYCYEYERSKT